MDRQRFAEKMKTASDHVDAVRVEEVMRAAMRRLTDENEMLPGQVLASMYLMEETGELLAAVNRYMRGRVTGSDVLQEMADVMLDIIAMADAMGISMREIVRAVNVKLDREAVRSAAYLKKEH